MTGAPTTHTGTVARVVSIARRYVGELSRFLSVGAVAYVIDTGLFNLLRYGPGEVLADKPITAKIIVSAWRRSSHGSGTATGRSPGAEPTTRAGARRLRRRQRAQHGRRRGCLAFSHYVLGLTSPLADNISGNVVGTILGTVIRYVAYRTVVFTGIDPAAERLSRRPHP